MSKNVPSMKVVTFPKDDITFETLPKRDPKKGEVQVRVVSASLNPMDQEVREGLFHTRFLKDLSWPLVLGYDFAGTVEAVGEAVTSLKVGDRVFGALPYTSSNDQGSLSEFITIKAEEAAILPDAVPFHVGAASPSVGVTAIQSLVLEGGLRAGMHILIIGGGGGVGAFAVSAAKRLGATVTTTCAAKDMDRAKANGADTVIDRKNKVSIFDDEAYKKTFDIVFDSPSAYNFSTARSVLKPKGIYVRTIPDGTHLGGKILSIFSSKRTTCVHAFSREEDLKQVGEWLADGVDAGIDSRWPIKDVKKAFERQANPKRCGKVVVDVANSWK